MMDSPRAPDFGTPILGPLQIWDPPLIESVRPPIDLGPPNNLGSPPDGHREFTPTAQEELEKVLSIYIAIFLNYGTIWYQNRSKFPQMTMATKNALILWVFNL